MAVTVAVLKRTYGAGKANPINNAMGAGFSDLGSPASEQETRRGPHFHSASCAGNLNSMGGWGVQQLHRSSYRAAADDWQRQRDALDSTIEHLLQKLMPGSVAPAPGFSLLQQICNQSALPDAHLAISAPPGLDLPTSQLQNDVHSTAHISSTVLAPLGLCDELQAVQHHGDACDINKDTQNFENYTLKLSSTKFKKAGMEQSTSTDSNSDEGHQRGGRRTLLIAYFPRGTAADSLQSVFGQFGDVQAVAMVKHRCYGFVRFAKASAAEEAHNTCQMGGVIMHDSTGKAWHLKASWAKNTHSKGKGGKRARARATVQLADT